MAIEYRVVPINEAMEQGYPDATRWDGYYEDWEMALYRFENGTPVEFLASDGGEPEDNSFLRDGAWIAPALNAAYRLGVITSG